MKIEPNITENMLEMERKRKRMVKAEFHAGIKPQSRNFFY